LQFVLTLIRVRPVLAVQTRGQFVTRVFLAKHLALVYFKRIARKFTVKFIDLQYSAQNASL